MKYVVTMLLIVSPALVMAETAKPATGAPYESALRGYRSFVDETIVDWRATNDTVARIGGWRAYSKESFQARQREAQSGPAGVRR